MSGTDPTDARSTAPRLGIIFGTRPEVIKLFAVLKALEPAIDAGQVIVRVLSTGQQRQLVDQTMRWFGIQPDEDLDVMAHSGSDDPAALHTRLMAGLHGWMKAERLDRCVVQGDTSTAHAAALTAFYLRVPVSHIEAGLRTWDRDQPWPEELHRRGIALCADQHFCPTAEALHNLEETKIVAPKDGRAWVVGNTVVDALRLSTQRMPPPVPDPHMEAKTPNLRLFVTLHRRENQPLLTSDILPALRRVIADHPHVTAVVSVHPNPTVRRAVARELTGVPRIELRPPLDYGETLALVRDAALVVTDSGGLQEEATALGTPVVVLRQRTERAEAVDAGCAILPGTGAMAIAQTLHRLLTDHQARAQMARKSDVFGDGHAAERIVEHVLGALGVGVVARREGAA